MENIFDISNKVAVITGGAGLLGVQFAKVLADYGANVILTDYDINECKKKVKELSNENIIAMKLDVTLKSDWIDVLAKIFNDYGSIDILVNSAAYTNKTKTDSFNNTFENTTLESWNQMLNVNLITIDGPSGSGKSTLLNIIGFLDEPSQGEYLFLGDPANKLKEKQKVQYHRSHIGFIFQAFHLIEELNVYENIETPLVYRGVKGKERKALVADMLDRFNIVAKKDLFPSQLSGGQQQLVAIARAIIGKPKLLLADEPTGNLHSEQGEMIMKLLKKLNDEGMTIIQVTHSKENAEYGDRIITLKDGYVREK